jgi:hypothetical protein
MREDAPAHDHWFDAGNTRKLARDLGAMRRMHTTERGMGALWGTIVNPSFEDGGWNNDRRRRRERSVAR